MAMSVRSMRTVLNDEKPTLTTCAVTRSNLTIDMEIRKGNSPSTKWLLRDLEGKWLMESQTPGLMSAHCDGRMHVAVGAAINVHDLYTNRGDDFDEP